QPNSNAIYSQCRIFCHNFVGFLPKKSAPRSSAIQKPLKHTMANKRKKPLKSTCPCGSLLTYEQCCQRWHNETNGLYAPDAETLMRSRYSAYVLNQLPYLLATWHHSTRPADLEPNPP